MVFHPAAPHSSFRLFVSPLLPISAATSQSQHSEASESGREPCSVRLVSRRGTS